MVVYAAEYSEMYLEGDYGVLSLHTTKAGAYRARRRHQTETWEEDRGVLWEWMLWRVKAYQVQEGN